MTNIYTSALANLNATKDYNATNKKKIQALILKAADSRVCDMLTENNVEISRVDSRALYATEKVIKIVFNVTRDTLSIADLEKNSFAAIKCAINAMSENDNLLKSDIESAILSDCKVDKKRKKIVYQRQAKISAVAQVQQCIDMLKTLKIAKEVAKNTFEIQDTSLMQVFTESFESVAI